MKFLFENLLAVFVCAFNEKSNIGVKNLLSHQKVKRVTLQCNRTIVRANEEMACEPYRMNLILFNNISADFTQINWIQKALSLNIFSHWAFKLNSGGGGKQTTHHYKHVTEKKMKNMNWDPITVKKIEMPK